jgi:geranylgeranyl pyrophosphate synthase
LTITATALGGVYDRRVVDAAAAVELVQIGSLVHDDLLDGALVRRGVPTINGVEGSPTALLAGDDLLARAGERAASDVEATTVLVVESGSVDAALGHAEGFVSDAAAAATAVGTPWALALAGFARSYVAWALEAFVDHQAWPR